MAQRGILMIRTDVHPEIEAEWNHWYDTRHIAERLKIPGFSSVRRFVAMEGEPKYLTVYELADVSVLMSEDYLKLRDRESSLPPSSFEIQTPKLPNFARGLYEQIYPEKEQYIAPNTGVVFTVGHDVPPDKEGEFNAWYNTEHLPAMKRVPGFLTWRRFKAAEVQLPGRAGARMSGPKYCALYDLESKEILRSEAFMREKDSPWSSWMRSWFTRRFRILGQRIYPKP